jgi:pyroglutamyl-peptidase
VKKNMRTVLVTAFEPFGRDTENAAALVCAGLPDQGRFPKRPAAKGNRADEETGSREGEYRVVKRVLPVEFRAAVEELFSAMDEIAPELVLCLGQAGGRRQVTPERVAVNLMDAPIPDNGGFQPVEEPVSAAGPTAYFTNVPVKAVTEAAKTAGYPAELSHTAGTYVCNCVFYMLLNRIAFTPANEATKPLWGDFIHVPYVQEQKNVPQDKPSLPLGQVVDTVRFLMEETLGRMEETMWEEKEYEDFGM